MSRIELVFFRLRWLYLSDGSYSTVASQKCNCEVNWHADTARRCHQQSKNSSRWWVFVFVNTSSVSWGRPHDKAISKSSNDHWWSDVLPCESEIRPRASSWIHFVSVHVEHVLVELVFSIDPCDGNCLEEDNCQKRDSVGSVAITQLEDVHASLEKS